MARCTGAIGLRAVAAVAALALAVGPALACGGGGASSARDQARQVVEQFLTRVRAGSPAACDLLSRHFLARQGQQVTAARKACRAGVRQIQLPPGLRVASVQVGPRTAIVQTDAPQQPPVAFGLVREGGGYRIDTVGGGGGGGP